MKTIAWIPFVLLVTVAHADEPSPAVLEAARCTTLSTEKCPSLATLVGAGETSVALAVTALGARDRRVRLVGVTLLSHEPLGTKKARAKAVIAALPAIGADLRGEALQLLGELGGEEAVAPLTKAITDRKTDGRTRIYAANGLGVIRSPAARTALSAALDDPSPRVQEAAARNLGRLGDKAAVPALITRATAEMTAGFVRAAAATSLGRLGDRRAIAPLVLVLATETPAARMAAARALGALGDKTVVPALLTRLSDLPALAGVVDALGKLGDRRATAGLASIAASKASGEKVRLRALWALGSIGDASTVPTLAPALRGETLPIVRAVVEALGQIGSPTAATHLIPLLDSDDKGLRETVGWALQKCTGAKHGSSKAAWQAWQEGR